MSKWLFFLAILLPIALLGQFATPDRVSERTFWPTQTRYARDLYAGEKSCAQCHESLFQSAELTPMAHAAMRSSESSVLTSNPSLTFTQGSYQYGIRTKSGTSIYTVMNGSLHESAAIEWAFGSNGAQSWLYKKGDGEIHEVRVTYFQNLHALNVTPNRSLEHAQNIDEPMSRTVGRAEVYRCFACHATESGTGTSFDESKLIPGVKCEACHGPGRAHIDAIERGSDAGNADGSKEKMQGSLVSYKNQSMSIFDPKELSPEESVDFCGACHGSYWDITLDETPSNINRVRFEPYRLEQSKCWNRSDARLTCIACHDPHKPLDTETTHYDKVCLGCHLTETKAVAASPDSHAKSVCHVAKNNCVSCHMPQVYVPAAHRSFPDHRIRIAHEGEPFPD
jgi:hypothetical protein